mgnify:CR=1 FL=1
MAGTVNLRRSIPALAFACIIAGKIDFRRRIDIGMNQTPQEDWEARARLNRGCPIGDLACRLLASDADLCCRLLGLLFKLCLPPDQHVRIGSEGAFKL